MGFLLSNKGIVPNQKKIQAILSMTHRSVKEVQHLTGKLATLNRFITCLGEHALLFFKTLRNITNFKWTSY